MAPVGSSRRGARHLRPGPRFAEECLGVGHRELGTALCLENDHIHHLGHGDYTGKSNIDPGGCTRTWPTRLRSCRSNERSAERRAACTLRRCVDVPRDALRARGDGATAAQDPPCTLQAIYRQGIPAIGLSIERGTEGVPDDGQFHVVLNGEEVFASRSQKAVTARYRVLKDELMPLKEGSAANAVNVGQALRKEIADRQTSSFLAGSAHRKRANGVRRGGGGSGGSR